MENLVQSYEISRQIGAGGMATVFIGRHPALNRNVAIKVVKGDNKERTRRFGREAVLSASLKQENLPAIYDYFVDEHKNHYLVMEYVEGIDVSEILKTKGPLPAVVCAMITREVARGLEHMHAKGIIHRDIKPSNVRLSVDGGVKLMDFGIAKEEDEAAHRNLTATGVIIGTPSYMSPEQATGDRLTTQSDVYSVGTMMYELLCGSKPYAAETNLALVTLIAQGKFVPLNEKKSQLPDRLTAIVHRAMEKDLSRRYPTIGDLIHDLNAFIRSMSQSEMTERLRRFYIAVTKGPYDPSSFNDLPDPAPSTLDRLPDPPRPGFSWSSVKFFRYGALAALLAIVLWFGWTQWNTGPSFGNVTVRLQTKDPELLKQVRVFVNDREENFSGSTLTFTNFTKGRNSLRIRYPLTLQTYEWHFLLDQDTDIRQANLNLDSLIAAYHSGRNRQGRMIFIGESQPPNASVYVDQLKSGLVGRTPVTYDETGFRYGSHDIFFEKDGFTSFGLKRALWPHQSYFFSVELDPLKSTKK